jgi:hypothetical protein
MKKSAGNSWAEAWLLKERERRHTFTACLPLKAPNLDVSLSMY